MPRLKKKIGPTSWQQAPHSLSEKARAKIMKELGLDRRRDEELEHFEATLDEIEKCLGFYKGATEAYKKMPRTADYRSSLKRFASELLGLRDSLNGYVLWERNSIESYGIDLNGLEAELEALAKVSQDANTKHAEHETKGRPKDEPRLIVIKHLRRIFENVYENRFKKFNYKIILEEKRRLELAFVKTALKDAGIPCPKNLIKLFEDPIATPFSVKATFWPGPPNRKVRI